MLVRAWWVLLTRHCINVLLLMNIWANEINKERKNTVWLVTNYTIAKTNHAHFCDYSLMLVKLTALFSQEYEFKFPQRVAKITDARHIYEINRKINYQRINSINIETVHVPFPVNRTAHFTAGSQLNVDVEDLRAQAIGQCLYAHWDDRIIYLTSVLYDRIAILQTTLLILIPILISK